MQFYLNDAKKQHMFAETCLYESVGSLPVMPSLLPPVLWGRSQVSFFLQVWWALWGLGVSLSTILWHSVLLVEETGVPAENHWPATNHWQILLQNVVSSTPHQSGIQTHVSGDRHWLHRQLETQLPYDHNQDGPLKILEVLLKIELLYHKFFNMWLDSMFCAAF